MYQDMTSVEPRGIHLNEHESQNPSMTQTTLFDLVDTIPIDPQTHSRHGSATSDEFGSFVSVSAGDDPLASLSQANSTPEKTFDTFAEHAKQRAERNERRLLDEIRAHEQDPMAWLNTREGSKLNDSAGAALSSRDPAQDIAMLVDVVAREGGKPDQATESKLLSNSGLTQDLLSDVPFESSSAAPLLAKSSPLETPSLQPVVFPLQGSSFKKGGDLNPADGPKERAEQNEERVLGELRAHDDDPLGWLKSKVNDEDAVSSALREAGTTLIDLSTPTSEAPPSRPRSPIPSFSTANFRSTSPRPPSLPRSSSSPLVPRSPDRARSQSPTNRRTPTVLGTGTSFSVSRSWMSSLGLFSSPRTVPASPSPSAAHRLHDAPPDSTDSGMSPTQSSLHALVARNGATNPNPARHTRFTTEGHAPMHAATMPMPTTTTTVAADASPFAPHTFIPPSGAPGFSGDHNWNPGGFEFDVKKKDGGKGVRLVGRRESTTPVLDVATADEIRSHLPPLARLSQNWTLLYSADQDGLSLNTLYARCTPPVIVGGGGLVSGAGTGTLVALQDAEGGIFGAWVPEGVHLSHGSYYGGGDSFLWCLTRDGIKKELNVFKWTGRNGYVALCDTEGFSFGGGDGHYGLYVDGSLVEGTTHPCPTFDNPCLAHGERRGRMVSFDAIGLEVWGVGS